MPTFGFCFYEHVFSSYTVLLGHGPYFLPLILSRRQLRHAAFFAFSLPKYTGCEWLFHLELCRAKKEGKIVKIQRNNCKSKRQVSAEVKRNFCGCPLNFFEGKMQKNAAWKVGGRDMSSAPKLPSLEEYFALFCNFPSLYV